MNKVDVAKLIEEFTDMKAKLHNLANSENWKEYSDLESKRHKTIQDLCNSTECSKRCDNQFDYVHDAILSEGDGVVNMPIGYVATILASYKNISKTYNTFAFVETPIAEAYFIQVTTYGYVKEGTVFKN